MTLTRDQARAMLWPFCHPRRPMGTLLDQGALTVHDLQRATRKAYSPRFKAACLLLLNEMLPQVMAQPEPPARSVVLPDRPVSSPMPRVCPICESRVQAEGNGWACVADRTHYWLHRAQSLQAARQCWLDRLPLDQRQYLDEAWLTTCDRAVREQYLSDHALKYPANS